MLESISPDGFATIPNVYNASEIDNLVSLIDANTSREKETYRKSDDLFAIRQFHREIPEVLDLIFNDKLKRIINENFGKDHFITKSIYFDKPSASNWFVAYHQDLTISVNRKIELEQFENWTVKQGQFAVQPPIAILENAFTIRIHLDATTKENGALKLIPGSHRNGVQRVESIDALGEYICEVPKGGIMIMKPLLFHASNKTTNDKRRRVIHIEFNNTILPDGLEWSEKAQIG